MSTKTNITMNSIYKLLVIFTIFMFSQRSFSQRNADPGIGILMVPATVTQGSTGTLSAGVGNYGNSTIVANSLRVTISVGLDAEIIGIATGSDSRWTQLSLTSGSGNTIRLKNTEGGFGAFDVGYILITIRGNLVSGPDLIFGNIVYITASNTLLCGICPPIPLNVSQGNASTSNDNSQTSLAVTSSVIDAVVDTFPSQTPGTTVPTTVGNVTTNDTLNGVPVTASNTDVTPVTTGPLSIDALGVVTLAPNTPSGSYPITYTICEVNPVTGLAVTPANCDSVTDTIVVVATIDAVVDTFPSQTPGTTVPTTVGNVTTNDTLNGVPVTASNTDVTPVTTGPLSIDALGVVTLAPNTPSGSYPITYTICEVNPVTGLAVTPANCDSVTDTIVVVATIDAVVDTFPSQTPGTTVPTTVGNVTTNDTLNGVPVTASNTDVTPVTTGPLSIDALGVVTLAPNTPSGSYPITYTICEVNPVTGLAVTPANCDSVTDTIVVVATIDAVVDTFPSQTPGTTVPTTVGNVTTNDTLNGVPVTASNTDVTPVTTGPLSIDALGVVTLAPNTPSGSYPITYTICEVNPVTGIAVTPANCDSVTITIIVVAPIIDAITETTTPSINGHVGGLTLPLTNNDLLNGMPVVVGVGGNVTISLPNTLPIGLSLNTTTGIVTVAPNTPAGIYPVTYTICEIINPSNCDTVTSYIVVYLTDFTPTIDIDNVVFLTPEVTRDFVVNISEIESSPSVGQIIFKIPKQQAFSITYDSNATNSNVNGGTIVNNNDWIITENSIFITVTLKPNIVIEASAFSSVGFKISRKINVPNQTWQPITATIVSGSGSDSVNDNNTYNVLVKAQ